MTTDLCARARARGPSKGTHRETLLQTLSGCCSIHCLPLGPVHAGLSLVRKSSLGPGSEWAVTSLLKHCGASSSCFSLAVNTSVGPPPPLWLGASACINGAGSGGWTQLRLDINSLRDSAPYGVAGQVPPNPVATMPVFGEMA